MISFKQETLEVLSAVSQTVLECGATEGIKLWHRTMTKRHNCAAQCLYNTNSQLKRCGFCLEARLRTLNLYHRNPFHGSCAFLQAARALSHDPAVQGQS